MPIRISDDELIRDWEENHATSRDGQAYGKRDTEERHETVSKDQAVQSKLPKAARRR